MKYTILCVRLPSQRSLSLGIKRHHSLVNYRNPCIWLPEQILPVILRINRLLAYLLQHLNSLEVAAKSPAWDLLASLIFW